MKNFRLNAAVLFLYAVLLGSSSRMFAQGTAFTYQGQLSNGGSPATGIYDFQFTVRDAVVAGNGVGTFPLSATLPVTNGLFTVTLDPGAGVFTGATRWLEIAVRTSGAGAYTTLVPRQSITATPYAVRSAGAAVASSVTPGAVTAAGLAPGAVSQVSNPSGSINALQVDANGLIGVGTNFPQAGLHVASGNNIVAPHVLASMRDELGGYTNLLGARTVAVFDDLLAVGSIGDNGITLVDIADPQSPVLLTQFRDGEGGFKIAGVNALAMKANLLVVGTFNTNVLTVIGLATPAAPVKLAELQDGVGGWNELGSVSGLAIRGNLLAIASETENAVTLADISNPAAPIKRVEMKDGAFGFNNLGGAIAVAISGDVLAIGAFNDHAVTLVDVSDPSNPIKLSELRDGVGGFNGLSNVYKVAFSTNGVLAISGAFDHAVTLVDVSNPAIPVKLAELVDGVNGVESLSVATGVAFSGNWLAAVGAGEGAVTLFDVSNPSLPRTLAVMRDGVGGFDYLGGVVSAVFAGTNLVVPSANDDAATLIGFSTAAVGIVSQQRVGIGTTQPRAALDVVGDVIVENATLFDVNASHIELGIGSTASGSNSVAIGNNVLATGLGATALGDSTKASGNYSTALGLNTKASGFYSLSAGSFTEASGTWSVALGDHSRAEGSYSFAMGYSSVANGVAAVSIGYETMALGNYSFALGRGAEALHDRTFIWGDGSGTGNFQSTGSGQFLIQTGGGVGINTNNPGGADLSVNGTVVATDFIGRFSGNGNGLSNLTTAANYLFTYDTTSQGVTVANTFQDVTFNNDARKSGWGHTAGTGDFTANAAGLYLVQYTAQAETLAAGASTVSVYATLNGTEIPGSQSTCDPATLTETIPVSKSFLLSTGVSGVLRLRFTGTTTNDRLISGTGAGAARPSVSMTIIRIQ
ncbi:MAG TPA: hypothetical protein VK530_03985 [Candidatus Acidoferrum sp.]|nr:hypothetical protein [Candidatus Acidoferrum sp.]